jgi:hypothetical protein
MLEIDEESIFLEWPEEILISDFSLSIVSHKQELEEIVFFMSQAKLSILFKIILYQIVNVSKISFVILLKKYLEHNDGDCLIWLELSNGILQILNRKTEEEEGERFTNPFDSSQFPKWKTDTTI